MINDFSSYIWRLERPTGNRSEKQNTIRMIDMNQEQMLKAYQHCKDMLFNDSRKNPGRVLVLEQLKNQLAKCNAEGLRRWYLELEDENGQKQFTNSTLLADIRTYPYLKEVKLQEGEELLVSHFVSVPADFKNVTIEDLKLACLYHLGNFDHSHLTFTFLFNMGVWYTYDDEQRLEEQVGKNDKAKLERVKEWIGLDPNTPLKFSSSGLSVTQLTEMFELKKKRYPAYYMMNTVQLTTLRTKVLDLLIDTVEKHAKVWKLLMKQIEEVAQYKGYDLQTGL